MAYELLGGRYIPRTAIWGDAPVLSSDGTRRPPLQRPVDWLTVHYTGNDVRYGHRDQVAALKNLHEVMGTEKPWEYNFVFFQDGGVAEYAGFFRAAHSKGENDDSLGCLFLNGIDEPLTDAQIDSFRRFREDLRLDHDVVDFPQITPHKNMPGASTACPGPHILARWNDLASGGVVVVLPPDRGIPAPTLRLGSAGPEAHRMINVLKFWRWYPARHVGDINDSRVGPRAVEGIRTMQLKLGLPETGVYSPGTAAAYRQFLNAATAGRAA